MMIIFAFKKAELKEKTQDANFSLPTKNPNPLLKNGSRIRIRIANPRSKGPINDVQHNDNFFSLS